MTYLAQEVGLSVGREERDGDVLISNQCTRGENRLLEPTWASRGRVDK